MMAAMTTILIVPGLGGSGPTHWQSRWEAFDARCVRVAQRDWDAPECAEWCDTLERAVLAHKAPVLLVAHSLGCLCVAHWALRGSREAVRGALLVAPCDADSAACTPAEVRDFAPIPRAQLPFPSVVVASSDDPFAELARVRELARAWGALLVELGAVGHINADSGLGDWPEGRALLAELEQRLDV
jgi:predicted alpha/beta hydrolase family esterase